MNLYNFRWNHNNKDGTKFLYCYHIKDTKERTIKVKCKSSAILDPLTRRIEPNSPPHNHPPDTVLLQKLQIKKKVMEAAKNSNGPLNMVFKDATRGQPGAGLVGYGSMSR